jgi:hypothetical protein
LLLDRAAGQSLTGILANDPEEAVYLVNYTDDHGAKSRALVAMSSLRSTWSPGSSQDAPRSREMSSSTPRPTKTMTSRTEQLDSMLHDCSAQVAGPADAPAAYPPEAPSGLLWA